MATLYDLKAKLSTVGAALKQANEELMDKLANPDVPIEEIKNLKERKADLQERFDTLQEAHDNMVAEQQAKLKMSRRTVSPTPGLTRSG